MALIQQAGRSMILVQKTIFCEETLQHLCPKSMTHPYSLSAKLGLFPAMFAFMQGDSPPRKKVLCPRGILRKAVQLREKLIQQHPAGTPGASRCLSGPWQPNFRSISSAFDSFNFFHII